MPEKRPVVPEDLLRIRLPGDVQIVPGGDLIIYVEKWNDPDENKSRARIRAIRPAVGDAFDLTGGDGDTSPRVSPDGTRLAFLRKGAEDPQIWILPLRGGEAWQLTNIRGGVDAPAWSPTGDRLAFTASLDEKGIVAEDAEKEQDPFRLNTADVKVITELAHKLDGEGYFGPRRPCLCVVEAEAHAQPRQLTQPPYRVSDPSFTPDGDAIIFASRRDEDYDRYLEEHRLYRIPVAGGDAVALTEPGAGEPAPSQYGIAYVSYDPQADGYDNAQLYLLPPQGGEARAVAPDFDRTIGNSTVCDLPATSSGGITWAADGKSLLAIASIDGTAQLCRFDLRSGEVERLTEGRQVVYGYAVAGGRIALAVATPTDPGNIYLLEGGSLLQLTHVNRDFFAEVQTAEPEFFAADSGEGHTVDTWAIRPQGAADGHKVPTILMIHGGPMSMYAHTYFFEFQLMAASGMGVVYTNPRGSQGYGRAFCEAIRYEWGNKDLEDIYTGLDAAIARFDWIDPERLGVGGGSYGGYMTNWIVGHTDRFKAAVSGRSVVDWRAMVGTGDGGWDWTRRAGGVPPWVDDTWYRQQSPITYVENIRTPLLIENQEGDLRCPLEQGMMLYSAVKWLGRAPVRFVRYPDEFHGMNRTGKPWNRIHRLREMRDWYLRYLVPRG